MTSKFFPLKWRSISDVISVMPCVKVPSRFGSTIETTVITTSISWQVEQQSSSSDYSLFIKIKESLSYSVLIVCTKCRGRWWVWDPAAWHGMQRSKFSCEIFANVGSHVYSFGSKLVFAKGRLQMLHFGIK